MKWSAKSGVLRALCAVLLLSAVGSAETSIGGIAQKVDQRYNRLRTLSAEFTESYRGPGIWRTESGTLWLKKPGKMRWEYHQPEKLFVSDGKTAYFYVPGDRQARRAPVKNLDDLRSPLRYLLGKTKLQKEIEHLSLAPDVKAEVAGDFVLRGIPKGMEDRVSTVLLEVSQDGEIRRVVLDQVDGSTTEFHFTDQRENARVPENRFHFTPPPGVEMVEVPEVGQ